ncbi:MAG: helix-turn-helix domain-containing protein [Pseudomonadota bacterium]
MKEFPQHLRHWRKARRLSQLNLALTADISARHLSFLESGRSKPSKDMIMHLGEVLEVPLAAINGMLLAAGFAPQFGRTALDDAAMAPVTKALKWTLDRHTPYPGLALDRLWTIQSMNAPAEQLFAGLGLSQGDSLLDLMQSPVMPEVIENWPTVAHLSALRLRAESAAAGGHPRLDQAAEFLMNKPAPETLPSGPAIPAIYRFGEVRLSLLGMISVFSSANDETIDDLRLELFYPEDAATEAFLKNTSTASA